MTLYSGAPVPGFSARSHRNPAYAFDSVAGRYVLLAFLPVDAEARQAALRVSQAGRALLNDSFACAFLVTGDEGVFLAGADARGLRWFHDPQGEIARLYDAVDDEGQFQPRWVLIDPSLRLIGHWPIVETEQVFGVLGRLPAPDDHAGVPLNAPVLIVPRVLEPAFCRELIAYYHRTGGEPSGTMHQVDGRTVGRLSDFKKRRDAQIESEELRAGMRQRLSRRLLPELEKAFQYKATRIERYIVACYDAEEGGYFRPHRDNTTAGTAHRQFAVSINLNAEEFEGGDLRFPEFGGRTYRPPTGGAVVFSCSLLHEATAVTKGTRYATLPFLYDDASAAVRVQNLHLLQPEPAAAE
ncbi:MAG: peroxiredoxin [Phenylobacterium zucineum]|nr:MAG: peroxiredoxin [Phenylobacterium zucineum]